MIPAGTVERGERKRTVDEVSKADQAMSKPRVDPTFGISSVDVLKLTERHPACRWREAQPGSCKERENLAGDAKGKGASGSNREAESTDAPERGGLLRRLVVQSIRTTIYRLFFSGFGFGGGFGFCGAGLLA